MKPILILLLIITTVIFIVKMARKKIKQKQELVERLKNELINPHFEAIQREQFQETLQQHFPESYRKEYSDNHYQKVWQKRLEEMGPLKKWEIVMATQEQNLLSGSQHMECSFKLTFEQGEERMMLRIQLKPGILIENSYSWCGTTTRAEAW